jgi:hypothetical protein
MTTNNKGNPIDPAVSSGTSPKGRRRGQKSALTALDWASPRQSSEKAAGRSRSSTQSTARERIPGQGPEERSQRAREEELMHFNYLFFGTDGEVTKAFLPGMLIHFDPAGQSFHNRMIAMIA